MRIYWTTAALLSLSLAVACSDRGPQNASNFEDPVAAPSASAPADEYVEPAPAPAPNEPAMSPRADSSTGTTPRPRATAGRSTTTRPAAPSRDADDYAPLPERTPSRPSLNEAPAAPAPPRVQWRELTVPNGTSLPLELQTALSSETAQIETPVSARLQRAIQVDGHTVIPAGAILNGTVTDVDRAGRVKGRSRLAFTFTEVRMNGNTERIRTNPVTFEGEESKGEDATKIGAGAGIGAIIGGIVGGGSGAAKGAAIGGAAGTGAVLATRGKEITLASGTDITATMASPLQVQVQVD